MTEAYTRIFGHRLHFERQNAQLVHHPCHAIGHHPEVFGAYQHACGFYQLGQLFHRLVVPELVVATIIVVVVKAIEHGLVLIPKSFVDEGVLNRDAGMIAIGSTAVAYEKHIVH